jgi:hypothetical protein
VNPGVFKTVLKVQVVNSATNAAISNAKVNLKGSTIIKYTSEKGFATFKDIAEGGVTLVLHKNGFKDTTETGISIAHGEKKTVVVKMEML